MKIGILGGTLSPIHDGHLRLARTYMAELKLDKILIIPTKIPPHKEEDNLPNGEHRCEMIRLALAGEADMELCDIEQKREGKSYSADTVDCLMKLYPQDKFYFLMGSDMFMTFQSWHRAQELLKNVTACTMARVGSSDAELEAQAEKLRSLGGSAVVIHAEPLDISSTQIRERLASGERNPRKLGLKAEVLDYILQNSLYGTDVAEYPWRLDFFEAEAQRLESQKRFAHSKNVAVRAEELARIYGTDLGCAYVAGLLHDICKDIPKDELLQWLGKSDIIKDKIILEVPGIWHGPAAAVYIKDCLGVKNRDILSAVACHTTGKPEMSLFDKLLYIADLTSSERRYPLADELRELAETDMDKAMYESLVYICGKSAREGFPMTEDTKGICIEYGLI